MKVLLIGSTGATGYDLLELMMHDERIDSIATFARRDDHHGNEKVSAHVVDFDQIGQWQSELTGDVLMSTMGTTLKDAGSQQAQWKVDFDYQYNVAKAARENGVDTFVLMSSINANSRSKFFYMKMKGQLEEAVKQLGFKRLVIVQPPALIRKNTTRLNEKLSLPVVRFLNKLGLMKSMAPISTEAVAKIMLDAAMRKDGAAIEVIEVKK